MKTYFKTIERKYIIEIIYNIQNFCNFFESFLSVLHDIGRKKDLKKWRTHFHTKQKRNINSFENPAFDVCVVEDNSKKNNKERVNAKRTMSKNISFNKSGLRIKASIHNIKHHKANAKKKFSKLKSCSKHRYKKHPYIPKIRL